MKPFAETIRGAFEALAEGDKLPESVRRGLLGAYDDGRTSQIEEWARRLDGEPHADARRSTGHAKSLPESARIEIASMRRIAAEARQAA